MPIDSITRKSLDELNRLIDAGNRERIDEYLRRVINGAGYIRPLARVFYRLAQNQEDTGKLAQHYGTILSHWPDSAWAQKAAIEAIPIILMSGGGMDPRIEELILENENALLTPSGDAASIGEDADLLLADVFINLVYLAHHNQRTGRIEALGRRIPAEAPQPHREAVELALAYAELRNGNRSGAADMLNAWLEAHPESGLRAFALLTLFRAEEDAGAKASAAQRIRQRFPDTIEALILRGSSAARP